MVTQDLKSLRQILEEQLKGANSSQALGDSIHVHRVADPADMTQEAAQREIAVRMLDRESAVVRQLRSAIERIKDGSYGLCLECEDEIAPARLKAIPWAELCIHCQGKAEDRENQQRRGPRYEDLTEAA